MEELHETPSALLIGLCSPWMRWSMVPKPAPHNVPPPMPAPAPEPEHHRHDVDRQEAVQIAVNAAAQHRVSHASDREGRAQQAQLGRSCCGAGSLRLGRSKCALRWIVAPAASSDYWSEVEHQKKKHHHDRHHGHDDDDHDD
jgi:hypothetical protein